jgi:hypothetical protein
LFNNDLDSKQDSLGQGVMNGNIDSIGLAGGLPLGLCWCHSTACTGVLPFNVGDDVFFFLLSLSAATNITVQLCMPYSYSYNMAVRTYVNGAWTTWESLG